MASVRFDSALEARLERVAKITGKTKSRVIKDAVEEHCDRVLQQEPLGEALAEYIGAFSSGGKSDSRKIKAVFGKILEKKRRTGHL
ncbi:MAG TPA: hypothetical protein VFA07_13695 [Chthonomonadaceae bacterium]|nr:hypothetical protein [Chthonomonadaceae bacterium]